MFLTALALVSVGNLIGDETWLFMWNNYAKTSLNLKKTIFFFFINFSPKSDNEEEVLREEWRCGTCLTW